MVPRETNCFHLDHTLSAYCVLMAWESEPNGWSAVTVIAGTNKMASKRSVAASASAAYYYSQLAYYSKTFWLGWLSQSKLQMFALLTGRCWRTTEVLQHGGSILSSIILWDNAHLKLGELSSLLLSIISQFLDFIYCVVFGSLLRRHSLGSSHNLLPPQMSA